MLKRFFSIKKFLSGRGTGHFSSFLHGAGIDLAENRQYVAGDEKRAINWKMSAKYDKLFVNLFHDEKAIDVHFCCDVNYNRKGENLETFMWFFAELTEYFQSRKAHIVGKMNDQSFLQVEKLGYQRQFLEELFSMVGKTIPFYSSSLQELLQSELHIPKRRLIIIVSDFLAYGETEKRLLGQLREKHEVRLVQIPTRLAKISEALLLTTISN